MPKELKEALAERLRKRLKEIGKQDLYDKIATESGTPDAGQTS